MHRSTRRFHDSYEKERDDNTDKAGRGEDIAVSAQIHGTAEMQPAQPDEPCDKRPDFLDIPAPESSPDLVRPDRAEEHTHRHAREKDAHTVVKSAVDSGARFFFYTVLREHHDKRDRCHYIGDHIKQNVRKKPRRIQCRRKLPHSLCVHKA